MMKRKAKEFSGPKSKKAKKAVNNDTIEDTESKQLKDSVNEKTLKRKKEANAKYEKPLIKSDKPNTKNFIQKNNANGKTKFFKATKNNSTLTEKPDWPEFKKNRKKLKEKRKAKKLTNVYEISIQAKLIGEKLRKVDCSEQERKKLILKQHDLLETHYSKVIFTHDLSRVIQWMLRYCESDVREAILEELKPSLVSIFQSKYGKYCIKNMLKYGSQEVRSQIISACYGNVVTLCCHSVSAPLLAYMYSTWAKDKEKINFKQEFYGDLYKQAKDKDIKVLSDVYKNAENMKSATLSAVKGNLLRVLNKKLLDSELVHCIIWEFLNNCTVEDRNEIMDMLRSSLVELSRTKIGTKVAVMCLWHSTNKGRKNIMKTLKEHVKSISISEHGYLLLLALFDCVDDTVLLKKIILSEIQKDLTEIALNEYGKHVILYLVARRNSHYFPPSIVEYLQQGDGNEVSKKPADIREKELLDCISDSLLDAITADTAAWMSNSSIAMVTLAILKVGSGDKLKQAFESVATFITDSETRIKETDKEYVPVEHAGLHMMLKKLVQNDKDSEEKGGSTFGEILVDRLTAEIIENWVDLNRGCFLLILLLENESKAIVSTLLSKLKPMSNIIKSKSSPGAKILLKKIQ